MTRILFAKRVFQAAGIWGLIVLPLGYLNTLVSTASTTLYENQPDYLAFMHGFFVIALAWQVAFLIIATDPVRYRLLMLAAMLEKFPFTIAVILLYWNNAVQTPMLVLGLIDGLLGVLFSAAYIVTEGADGDA